MQVYMTTAREPSMYEKYVKKAPSPLLMPTSLVDFQTAYTMMSQLSIIAWTTDMKNPNLYYSLVELITIAGFFYFELVQALARLLCFSNIDHLVGNY